MLSFPAGLRQLLGGGGGGAGAAEAEGRAIDTSETVHLSALSLMKMLRHGRIGVPMEVMGLMLGTMVDDYTIKVVDVFSMPQAGSSVSVEAVDPAYQSQMLDMLNKAGRTELVVGWYHSHPGFDCWFSGTDITTQQSFESLSSRAVGVVVDPIQSAKGRVIMDCFRLVSPTLLMMGQEPRHVTSNVGHINKPRIAALVHGLNRHYYSITTEVKMNVREAKVIKNLKKACWNSTLEVPELGDVRTANESCMENLKDLILKVRTDFVATKDLTTEERIVDQVGRINATRRLNACVGDTFTTILKLQTLCNVNLLIT